MQCYLGTEKDEGLTRIRLENRHDFRNHLLSKGIEFNYDSVLKFFEQDMDQDTKDLINKEKILNDFYRNKILGEVDILDNHDYENIKTLTFILQLKTGSCT